MFDFTTPGQSLYGAHLQRQQSGNRFWRQKGAEIFPGCGCACVRHPDVSGPFGKLGEHFYELFYKSLIFLIFRIMPNDFRGVVINRLVRSMVKST